MYKVYIFEELDQVPPELIKRMLELLPPKRREKALRYRKLVDRKNCAITYLILKNALKYFEIEKFTIGYGEFGKPYLLEYPYIHFNISHCRSGCAVAIADTAIGVDIQEICPISKQVIEHICTNTEKEQLEVNGNTDIERTELWVKKECFGKMLGTGLNYPLKQTTISNDIIYINMTSKNNIIGLCIKGKSFDAVH